MTDSITAQIAKNALKGLGHLSGSGLRKVGNQFAAAPLASSGVTVMAVLSLMAANNALFGQQVMHPTPFFFAEPRAAVETTSRPRAPIPAPAHTELQTQAPATNQTPATIVAPTQPTTVAEPTPAPAVVPNLNVELASGEVSNEQLAAAQEILRRMGLFGETVDGYYGPKTAEAIRAFELRNGLSPKGALDPEVINLILRTNLGSIDARTQITPAPVAPVQTQTNSSPLAAIEPEPAAAVTPTATPVAERAPTIGTGGTGQQALANLLGQQPSEQAAATAPLETTDPVVSTVPVVVDRAYIEKVQRALASLAFLHGTIDGVAGESTAQAIRKFEVFHNYEVTGSVTPELLDLLLAEGARID